MYRIGNSVLANKSSEGILYWSNKDRTIIDIGSIILQNWNIASKKKTFIQNNRV